MMWLLGATIVALMLIMVAIYFRIDRTPYTPEVSR